ncbi:beta-galactosidase [Actinoplanes sp. NPDC023714]|uniref:beta-galactosidase n=1 Tax=Actinoplanes sp. NPDC023714 TaxID=3154322 RepID=UPI0033D43C2F
MSGDAPKAAAPLTDSGEFVPSYYEKWPNSLPSSPDFFPIGVWLQDPNRERDGKKNSVNYKNAGINTFLGQWEFPTREDSAARLRTLREDGLYVFAGDEVGTAAVMDGSLAETEGLTGYHLGDEQDMSTNPKHITPKEVTEQAQRIKALDPSRPIYNNWGKAFALYPWVGAHDDEAGLKQYCSEVDISSSDYYAATDGYEPADKHLPNYYGQAVTNTRNLCGASKPAWGFVETGHPFADAPGNWPPFSKDGTIEPAAVEAAVWSMLAHGANGIVYFVHDFFKGGLTEDGLFDHPETVKTVTRVNAEVQSLAPILNAQRQPAGLTAKGADATLRADKQGTYVVAAENTGNGGDASFTVAAAAGATVEVVGENRTVKADASGTFTDEFDGWGHHVYKIPA